MNDVEKMLQDFMQHARNDGEFIIFDTETTGFSPARDRIISFSAIKAKFDVDVGKFIEIARLDQYINPERSISADITELTGIDYNRIKNEPTEDEAAFKIAPFLGAHPFIVGQNVGFDVRMVTAMASRCRFPFMPIGITDTLTLAKKMIGKRSENHKLETLMKFFDIKRDDLRFHESISDVIATGRVMEQFILAYQDKLDLDKIAKAYQKNKTDEAEFKPVADTEVPFFDEKKVEEASNSASNESVAELFQPTITGMTVWKKYAMKRIYVNVKEEGVKIWYDLGAHSWESQYTAGTHGRVDIDYVKRVTAEMIRKPEYKFVYDAICEAKEKGNR